VHKEGFAGSNFLMGKCASLVLLDKQFNTIAELDTDKLLPQVLYALRSLPDAEY
jgi:hypothetical protein